MTRALKNIQFTLIESLLLNRISSHCHIVTMNEQSSNDKTVIEISSNNRRFKRTIITSCTDYGWIHNPFNDPEEMIRYSIDGSERFILTVDEDDNKRSIALENEQEDYMSMKLKKINDTHYNGIFNDDEYGQGDVVDFFNFDDRIIEVNSNKKLISVACNNTYEDGDMEQIEYDRASDTVEIEGDIIEGDMNDPVWRAFTIVRDRLESLLTQAPQASSQ